MLNLTTQRSFKCMIKACFHTVCAAILPILMLYTQNIEQVQPVDVLKIIIFTGGSALILLLISFLFVRNIYKASLTLSLFAFLFLSHGHLTTFLNNAVFYFIFGRYFELLPVILFISGAICVNKIPKNHEILVYFLNVMMTVLLLSCVYSIVVFHKNDIYRFNEQIEALRRTKVEKTLLKELPDIFYIIIDGYASNDTLSRTYDYDNSSFTKSLESRGFYLADASYANYIQTNLSLSSSLNCSYLNSPEESEPQNNRLTLARHYISKNTAAFLLKCSGYTTEAFESGYDITELRNSDIYHSDSIVSRQFFHRLVNNSTAGRIIQSVTKIPLMLAHQHAKSIRKLFDSIANNKDQARSPVFVFAHICIPHPPFVFLKDGSVVKELQSFTLNDGSHSDISEENYRHFYIEQLHFANTKLNQLLDHLLQPTDRPKVIILQSDHGPGSSLNWESLEKTDLQERFGIINAIYFPDKDYSGLYPEISPVNTFRVIFNKYLGTNLELLEDRHYYSTWSNRYNFTDVTDKLKKGRSSISSD